MALVTLTVMIALAAATVLVLADSMLRLSSAVVGLKARHALPAKAASVRARQTGRLTTRVSYARQGLPASQRAAA